MGNFSTAYTHSKRKAALKRRFYTQKVAFMKIYFTINV